MTSENEVVWHPTGWSPVFRASRSSTHAHALIGFTRLRVFAGAERVSVTRPGLLYFGWCIAESDTTDLGGVWLL